MDNHRKKERVPITIIVKLVNGEDVYYNMAANISASGIFLKSVDPYNPGDHIDLEFLIPHSPYANALTKCKVEVIDCAEEDGKYAVHGKFIDLPEKTRNRIETAMDNLIIHAWYINEEEEKELFIHDEHAVSFVDSRRQKTRVPISMWIKDVDFGDHSYIQAKNISSDGIYIMTPVNHPVGSIITLEFHAPQSNLKITCRAKVINSRDEGRFFGKGLKFVEISDVDKKLLEKAIETAITDKWFAL